MSQLDRQIEIEHESLFLGQKRYAEEMASNGLTSSAPGKEQLKRALPALTQAIVEFLNVAGSAPRRAARCVPFLAQVDPGQAAYLTIRYALDAASDGHCKVNTVALRIATAIEEHLNLLKLAEESPGLYRKVLQQVAHSSAEHHRRGVLNHVIAKYAKAKLEWTNKNKIQVGVKLIELFDESCGLIELKRETIARHDTPVHIVLTDAAQAWLKDATERSAMWRPVHLPMVVQPRPWQMFGRPKNGEWDKAGGYITRAMNRFQLLQATNKSQAEIMDAREQSDPTPVLKAVNAIQATPWRINKQILKVIQEAWSGGEKYRELLVEADEPLPARPSNVPADIDAADMTPDQREALTVWKRDAAEVHAYNHRQKGKRISVSKKL